MPQTTQPIFQKKPTVFISYAHEGDLKKQVKALADWLAERGVEVITDHKYQDKPPAKGWRAWMQHSVEDADIVLIVCTERYKALFEKREVKIGGYGASWEGAIITNDIYQEKMRNEKFYPILPEDGEIHHLPVVLRDWSNGHRFPSGNEGILRLVNPNFESTISSETPQLQAQLQGSNDNRLLPREIEIIGRDNEIEQVVAFLNGTQTSASVSGYVAGSGGIGKTELCKAALRKWLQDNPDETAYWLEVDDNADNQRFLDQLAEAIGLSDEARAKINSFAQLQPSLPEGLYYLDNLENVVESDGGRKTLQAMAKTPGVRVLASSRVSLDRIFSTPFKIDHLDKESAYQLFIQSWAGDKDDLEEQAVKAFVMDDLGGHALSIVLMAHLGEAYSWISLLGKWQKKGTKLLKADGSSDRQDNLELSFDITREHLSKYKGALDLWQFIALFPDGVDSGTLDIWEEVTGFDGVRQKLVKHNLIVKKDNKITMLPPVSRYALSGSAIKNKKAGGFNWSNVRNYFYSYFLKISEPIPETRSSDAKIRAMAQCNWQLWAFHRFLQVDQSSNLSKKQSHLRSKKLHRLIYQLGSIYTAFRNVSASYAVILETKKYLSDSLVDLYHGVLARQVGKLEESRRNLNQAMNLAKKEKNRNILANTMKALGDLECRLGNVKPAREYYVNLIEYYPKALGQIGLANAYQALGELEWLFGDIKLAREHYYCAFELYSNEEEPIGLANTYRFFGIFDCRSGKVLRAKEYYDQAFRLCQKEQDALGLATTYSAQGDLNRKLGKVSQARCCYNKAIGFFKKGGYQLDLAKGYKGLGELAKDHGQLPEAFDYYEKAFSLYDIEDEDLGLASIIYLEGELDFLNGEYDSANGNYQKALDIYRKIQSQLGEAYVLKGQADILAKTGSESAAVMLYGKALSLYQKEQYPSGEAKTLIAMLECEAKGGILSKDELSDLAEQTWGAAQRSSLPPVMDKAREAIVGVLGKGFDFDKSRDVAEA